MEIAQKYAILDELGEFFLSCREMVKVFAKSDG